jgi:hypothetical protein
MHKFMRRLHSTGQRKVQFCTLLKVAIRIYCDSRNVNIYDLCTPVVSYKIFLYSHGNIVNCFAECS